MFFIKVHSCENEDVFDFVNIHNISSISPDGNSTLIYVGGDNPYYVAETPEEIFQMIAEVSAAQAVFVHNGISPHSSNLMISIFTPRK